MLTRSFDSLLNLLGILLWVAVCARLGLGLLPRSNLCHGPRHRTFPYKKNLPAYREYCRRMRTFFAFQCRATCAQNQQLIKKFEAGEYSGHNDVFDSDCKALSNGILDTIQVSCGQEVPDVLNKAHTSIETSYRLNFESVQTLQEALECDGEERARFLRVAKKKLKEAEDRGAAGLNEFARVWARVST